MGCGCSRTLKLIKCSKACNEEVKVCNLRNGENLFESYLQIINQVEKVNHMQTIEINLKFFNNRKLCHSEINVNCTIIN